MRAYDIVHKLQDMTHIEWSESLQTSAIGGTFLKSRTGVGPTATYYKLSCYDAYRGIYGHECVNEIIAARLMSKLGITCANYRLIHAAVLVDGERYETWLTTSKSFRAHGEKKIPFDQFYDFHHQRKESQLDLLERFGMRKDFEQIMLADYLIANRDRHGANIEILKNKAGDLRLVPGFDNGVSLLFSCHSDEEVNAFDVMKDVRANNYVGSRSLKDNLQFVSKACVEAVITEADKDELLAGITGVITEDHQEAIWKMVFGRWCEYANLRNI